MENKTVEEDPDEHYLGNVWGWKFSFVGLAMIVFFLGFALIRAKMLGVPLVDPAEAEEKIESVN